MMGQPEAQQELRRQEARVVADDAVDHDPITWTEIAQMHRIEG
jgi:hypothetical protein